MTANHNVFVTRTCEAKICEYGRIMTSRSVFATSLALLARTFHGRDRGTAFGVWGR